MNMHYFYNSHIMLYSNICTDYFSCSVGSSLEDDILAYWSNSDVKRLTYLWNSLLTATFVDILQCSQPLTRLKKLPIITQWILFTTRQLQFGWHRDVKENKCHLFCSFFVNIKHKTRKTKRKHNTPIGVHMIWLCMFFSVLCLVFAQSLFNFFLSCIF